MYTGTMHVEDALRSRTSIRDFLDTPVDEATVRSLLDAARWAPSGGNLQPWRVIAVAGAARDAAIEAAATVLMANPKPDQDDEFPVYPPKLWEPYRSRRYRVGEAMYALLGIPREDKPSRLQWLARNFSFFGAPVGLFFVIERGMGHGQWAHVGMFMQSLALAATARGLGTCMQESWGMVRKTMHAHFGLTEDEILYCGMALGHPNPNAEVNTLRSERAEVETFTRFEGFEA